MANAGANPLVAAAQRASLDGDHHRAVRLWQQALDAGQNQPSTHHNLGIALMAAGQVDDAIARWQTALDLDPSYAKAHLSLAKALGGAKRHAEAERHFSRSAELLPADPEVFTEWGRILLDQRQHDKVKTVLRQAVRLKPDAVPPHNLLGLAYLAAGEMTAAEACFARGLDLAPTDALIHQNYGTSLKEQGRLAEAIAAYDVALVYEPTNPSIRWNRSLSLLQAGDYALGWPEYEWRNHRGTAPRREFGKTQWDGRATLDGKTVLLHAEQGLGDTIQFCRFARRIKDRGAVKVVVEVQSPIAAVVAGCDGADEVVVEGGPLPPFDYHLPMMSAPAATQTTLGNLPARVPYLGVDPNRVQHWSSILEGRTVPAATDLRPIRVGIAWQGNPHHKHDHFRSMPLLALSPLAAVRGVRLFSLQRGPGTEQLDSSSAKRMSVAEVCDRRVTGDGDWADTAAIMMNLDLVISVDTAIAHLAGALGRPLWIALSKAPDWRWLLGRDDTPWYPTARLFRQRTLFDWAEVVSVMYSHLSKIGDDVSLADLA